MVNEEKSPWPDFSFLISLDQLVLKMGDCNVSTAGGNILQESRRRQVSCRYAPDGSCWIYTLSGFPGASILGEGAEIGRMAHISYTAQGESANHMRKLPKVSDVEALGELTSLFIFVSRDAKIRPGSRGARSPNPPNRPFFKGLRAKWGCVGGFVANQLFLRETRHWPTSILLPKTPESTGFLRFSLTRLRSNFPRINPGSGSSSASPMSFTSAF